MHKNRIVLAVTAAVVIALLFMGVGYAAFGGTARTYNQGNEQDLAYMSVEPGDFTAIIGVDVEFDSYFYKEGQNVKVAYAFSENETVVDADNYKAVAIGNKKLTVSNETGNQITEINVKMTASNGKIGNDDFVYILGVTIPTLATGAFSDSATYYDYTNGKYVVVELTEQTYEADTYFTLSSFEYAAFDNNGVATVSDLAITIDDGATADVAIFMFIGYEPDTYVPTNYIGPAVSQVTQGYHPYKTSEDGPEDLESTGFSIEVTDAS